MPVSDSYLKHVMELLGPLGDVTPRVMFGGYGIFHEGKMFGLISEDILYLKVNDTNRADYEKAGSHIFPHGISYWEAPEMLFDDPPELQKWAMVSISIARVSPKKKRK